MSRLLVLVLVLSAVDVPEASSQALRLNFYAREALDQRNICTTGSPLTQGIPCHDFSQWSIPLNTPYFVYLVAASASGGLRSFTCGIRYDPTITVWGWYLCADYQLSLDGWPASGAGNVFSWNQCQTTSWLGSYGAEAVAGAFYVTAYGDGILEATPHYLTPPNYELTVTGCDWRIRDGWYRGGAVGFGSKWGLNTCVDVFWVCPSGYNYRSCCCAPGSAREVEVFGVLEQTCEFIGGRRVTGLCDLSCEQICEQSVATERQTWGRVKTRFK